MLFTYRGINGSFLLRKYFRGSQCIEYVLENIDGKNGVDNNDEKNLIYFLTCHPLHIIQQHIDYISPKQNIDLIMDKQKIQISCNPLHKIQQSIDFINFFN